MTKLTKTLVGTKAREMILKGVNAIYEPVRRTLGPEGKNALIYRTLNRGERFTNDGITVAGVIEPKNPFVRMVACAFREACQRTNEKVGDGTTATVIIGGKLYNDAYARLSENQSVFESDKSGKMGVQTLKKNILKTAEKVKIEIEKKSKKIKTKRDLERIATISVENEEIGKIIADMAWEVGIDGFIDVVEGFKGKIETEVIKGMRFPSKVAANGFVNNFKKHEMVAQDCPVFITNYVLDNSAQLAKIINPFIKEYRKVIIISPTFSEQVLVELYKAMYTMDNRGNKIKNPAVDYYPVAVPSLRTDQFEDLATYCGARFIDKNKGSKLQNTQLKDLGFLEKLVVKTSEIREEAMAIGGQGTKTTQSPTTEDETGFKDETQEQEKSVVDNRIEDLKGQLEEEKAGETYKNLLRRRIASMASAVGLIKVSSTTDAENLYIKLKIEDAVFSCKAALRGGYVRGAGLELKEIADKLPDTDLLKSALQAPYEQIKASMDGNLKVTEDIIDPAEAIYYMVEHATSVVANLITVDILTPEIDEVGMGDGLIAVARQLLETNIINKHQAGVLKENEEEAYRDMFGNLTEDEFVREQENQN